MPACTIADAMRRIMLQRRTLAIIAAGPCGRIARRPLSYYVAH